MLFLAQGTIAGAHQPAFFAAALPYSDAAQGSVGQAAVIGDKLEMSLWLPGRVVCPEPQVLVEIVGLDQLAGVHLPIRIPRRLEFTKSLHQFRAEHFGK